MSPYTILGIKSNADVATAQMAYRRLAMQHHPDRGGNAETFKNIKGAWESIERGFRDPVKNTNTFTDWDNRNSKANSFKPETSGDTWSFKPGTSGDAWRNNNLYEDSDIDSIFKDLKEANRNAPNGANYNSQTPPNELVANVSLREAFAGFKMKVPKPSANGMIVNSEVDIPAGMPHNYRAKYRTSTGELVYITTRINDNDFNLRGIDNQNNLFSAGLNIGDVEIDFDAHAIDIVLGCWIDTKDFLGETLAVRIPEGFNPLHRLKIAGRGYYGWDALSGTPTTRRQDMYLRICPIYTPINKLKTDKIISLYKSIQALVPENGN